MAVVTKKALKLEGMDSLIKRLEKLSGPRLNEISDKMLRTGATPVKEMAKKKAPVRTGALRSKISIGKLRPRFGETAAIRIAARGKLAKHSHLVQLGTKDRYRGKSSIRTVLKRNRKTGKSRIVAFRPRAKSSKIGYTGRMPANPFFAFALRVTSKESVRLMENRLRKLMIKELKAV